MTKRCEDYNKQLDEAWEKVEAASEQNKKSVDKYFRKLKSQEKANGNGNGQQRRRSTADTYVTGIGNKKQDPLSARVRENSRKCAEANQKTREIMKNHQRRPGFFHDLKKAACEVFHGANDKLDSAGDKAVKAVDKAAEALHQEHGSSDAAFTAEISTKGFTFKSH